MAEGPSLDTPQLVCDPWYRFTQYGRASGWVAVDHVQEWIRSFDLVAVLTLVPGINLSSLLWTCSPGTGTHRGHRPLLHSCEVGIAERAPDTCKPSKTDHATRESDSALAVGERLLTMVSFDHRS
ncbi:hypothetical protein HJFPF1_02720 [Paramyrothecium foliicola]|nr:hypothetical protein HJFPF1_02720 [Paramyrothecium foliicola]